MTKLTTSNDKQSKSKSLPKTGATIKEILLGGSGTGAKSTKKSK